MMRRVALTLGAVLIAAIMAGSVFGGQEEPHYLLFWRGPEQVSALLKSIGSQGDGRHILGFGQTCSTFEQEKQVPEQIRYAFAAARKYNMAVMLHFDFHVDWKNRPDLWNWFDPKKPSYNPANKKNVEWYGWDGPPSKVRYLNWGIPQRMAPPMCFTSKQIRQEWTRLVRDVITPTLRQEIATLKREGKEQLFAGVLVGSEPMFDNYLQPDPETAKMMLADSTPKGRLGYRSLIDRGFSKVHPPVRMEEALGTIIQETVGSWCKQFVDAGIPAVKLYPHVAPQVPASMTGAPISAAFNQWSRPGWTTYPVEMLKDSFEPLYRELKKHGNSEWAGVEANAWFRESVDWETYLGWHYNHGAVIVAINTGATGTELPARLEKSAFSPEAIAAYRKFLMGETLKETPAADRPGARLRRKMDALQAGFKAWQSSGRDPSKIAEEVTERLQPLLQDERYGEAEAVIDEGIKKLGVEAGQ
ncbi:MAG: hypothetical protein ACYC27_16615 [Armatimonadota bacterium]